MAQHNYIVHFFFLWMRFDAIESSVNLAYNKQTSQSSIYEAAPRPSSKAVDGVTTQNDPTCTATEVHKTSAWWQVDLGFMSDIKQIHIYYRNYDNVKQRFNGYAVHIVQSLDPFVSHLCYQDPIHVLPANLTPTHYCRYWGQYVNMSVERKPNVTYPSYDGSGAIINLCELQVFGCKVGNYGDGNCDTICGAGCNNSRCDPDVGTCNCTMGWAGDKCTERGCPDGFYGLSCEIACPQGCVSNKCAFQHGSCSDGCEDSKFGTHCNKTCPINCDKCYQFNGSCIGECKTGYNGAYCNKTCSLGCKNNICFSSNGNCSEGCILGYKGIQCTDCVDGMYGVNCNQECPVNCNKGSCNKTNGFCLFGCTDINKAGNKCEECITGFHGMNCASKCPLNCINSECTKDSGECTMDCIENFDGPKCEECKRGRYGDSCNLQCSIDCKGNECNRKTGSCAIGCIAGKFGTQCNMTCSSNCATASCDQISGRCQDLQSSNQPSTINNGSIIGGIVAIVAVGIVLVIVVIIVLKRRRPQTAKKKDEEKDEIQLSDSNSIKPMKNEKVLDNPYVNTCEIEDQRQDELASDDTPTTSKHNVYENAPELQTTLIPITELSTLISEKSAGKEFDKEYKKLPSGAIHPHTIGQKAENKIKNRFLTTFPYDHSRVVLEIIPDKSKSDYINASYIDGVEKRFVYVATQGPKPNTVSDFWQMVWQVEAGKIVMLTNLVENGKVKCEKYWPDKSQSKDVGHLEITSEMEKEYPIYIERSLKLYNKKTEQARTINQYHFTMWPDHGTTDPVQLMLFHRKVRDAETTLKGPCIVHCSAGVGRTGTFIALDALHEYGERTGKIDIFEYVIRMRKDRMSMIQTVDQYIVLHEALLESFHHTGKTMKRDQFFVEFNEMQDEKPKNETHVYKEYQSLSSLRPVYGIEYYDGALRDVNKKKIRNHNILAVEKYRPYLMSHHSSRTDFINAVILPSCRKRCGYLATHYPLQHTIVDLWCMIFDHDSSTVVVLDEHRDKKEDLQWYPADDDEMDIEQFTITKVSGHNIYNKIQELAFTLKHKTRNEEKSVKMFILRPWQEGQCVPPDKTELLKLLELVNNCQKKESGPVTVICSDGAQCCGLFCTVNNVIQNLKIDDEIDIFHTVRQLQIRRPEFFADFEEYECCYDMIKCYLQSTNIYANA